jgi:hypothetical protein
MCHQLKLKLKIPVSGKNSTFAKVCNSKFNFYNKNISLG